MRSLFNALYWNPHTSVCSCLCWKNNRDKKKSHREPPVFARKEQAGQSRTLGTLVQALGAEATTTYFGPALVSRRGFPGISAWLKLQIRRRAHEVLGVRAFFVTDYPGSKSSMHATANSGQTESGKRQMRLHVRQSSRQAQRCRGQRRL